MLKTRRLKYEKFFQQIHQLFPAYTGFVQQVTDALPAIQSALEQNSHHSEDHHPATTVKKTPAHQN